MSDASFVQSEVAVAVWVKKRREAEDAEMGEREEERRGEVG